MVEPLIKSPARFRVGLVQTDEQLKFSVMAIIEGAKMLGHQTEEAANGGGDHNGADEKRRGEEEEEEEEDSAEARDRDKLEEVRATVNGKRMAESEPEDEEGKSRTKKMHKASDS